MNNYSSRVKCIEESRVFSTNEIILLQTDPATFLKLVDFEKNKELNDEDLDVKTQLAIDYVECYSLNLLEKSNRTPEETKFLMDLRDVILNEIKNGNVAFISSQFLKKNIVNGFFKANDIEIVKKYKEDVRAAAFAIFEKIKHGEKCTSKEQLIFFKYLTSNLSSTNEKVREAIDYIVKDNIENDKPYSIFEKQFLACYLAYEKSMNNNIPYIKPYITSIDLQNKKPSWGGLHIGYSSGSIIQINQKMVRAKKFVDAKDHGLAHVVLHEYEHWNQYYNTENNILNSTSYIYAKSRILRSGLSKNGFDEYMKNYLYKESERFANIKAYRETARLVGRFFKKTALEHNLQVNAMNLERQLDRGIQYDSDNNLFYIGDYNIEKMEEALKKNPQLLEKYPIMKNFYNLDGSFKSFQDVISIYTKYSIAKNYEALETFDEVLEYKITHGELNSLDFNKMDREDVLSILIILQDYLERQIKACKNMLDSYGNPNITQKAGESDEDFVKRRDNIQKQIDLTNFVFRRRAKMIKEIMNFAYRNKDNIDKYCKWNSDRRFKGDKNARITNFANVFYGYNGIRTVDSRIDSNPNVANSELVDEIRELASFSPGKR